MTGAAVRWPAWLTELARAMAGGIGPGLLERVRADLLRHAGEPLDDAALVLVRAPAARGDPAPAPGTGNGAAAARQPAAQHAPGPGR